MGLRTTTGGTGTDRLLLGLAAAAFVAVTLLLLQALSAASSYRQVASAALEDFAELSAQRLATELDGAYTAIFLDRLSAGLGAHEAWLAGATVDAAPRGRWIVPSGAVGPWFSMEGERIALRGGDPSLREEIAAAVVPHARRIYPDPAPYAVIRTAQDRAVVYRKGRWAGTESLYGFVVSFARMGTLHRGVIDDTPLLPPSLRDAFDPRDAVAVALLLDPAGPPIHARPASTSLPDPVRGEAFAAKAGRMIVRVDLDRGRLAPLLGGGDPGRQVRLLLALSGLTALLVVVAGLAFTRATRLVRARERFLANVSHDLRTPLAQMRMFSEMLLLGRLRSEAERTRALTAMGREAERLSALVENVLTVSADGTGTLRRESVELEPLLEEALEPLEAHARTRSATVERRVSGERTAALDPAAFRRIVRNLVDNALSYGPDGQTVRVEVARANGHVELRVTDEGPGIRAADRGRVWERFERLGRDGDPGGGTGLGLAVVRELAVAHGGAVRVDEGPDGGARVTVTLATDRGPETPR